ncbi:hypothetical protein ACWD5Q_08000 [Streptomyces sp. NPDC002513]
MTRLSGATPHPAVPGHAIDLADATLLPGLVDSHSHPVLGSDGLRAALATAERINGWVRGWGLGHL